MGSRRPGYYQPREDWDVPVLQHVNSQLEMYLKSLPGGSELSLSELQDMASRQQLQIDNQQQVLVAKEQRLKYLKQQEMKHAQMTAENERLRKLKEKVESQEMKLKKLRALRGQVEQHKLNNGNLTSELEGIKSLFNEKEKELALAVAKVEELTSQLETLRSGKALNFDPSNSPAALELEKLRKELMLRNKLNEQQNAKIVAHREMLGQRKDEISQMDRRIGDLQQRLKKKKAQQGLGQNYSVNNNNNNFIGNNKPGTRNGGTNVAAVEPYIKHTPKDLTKDDLHTNYSFERQDPKHQTLPPNLKFPHPEKGKVIDNSVDSVKNNNQANGSVGNTKDFNVPLAVTVDNSKTPLNGVHNSLGDPGKSVQATRPSQSQAQPSQPQPPQLNKYPAPGVRGGMGIANFTPKPFGSTYSTSMLSGRPFTPGTSQPSQPVVSAGGEVRTGGSGQSSPANSDNSFPVSSVSQPSQVSQVSSSSSQDSHNHPPKPLYSTAKLNHVGPSHSGINYPQPSVPPLSRDTKPSTVPPKQGNSAHPNSGASVSERERGPTLPPRQSSTSSNSSMTPFPPSSKHPMQTPLQRPSQRVPTTPQTPVTSASTSGSDSNSPPKPSSKPGPPVPITSGSRLGPVLANSRWPKPSTDPPTSSPTSPPSSASATVTSRSRLLSGGANPPVSNGTQNIPTSSPNGIGSVKPETTQASVTSALNALLQPGAAGQNLRVAPRYASKSVIANTYTRKLGSGAMEQYRKNMSKLYQGFGDQPQAKTQEETSSEGKPAEPGKPQGNVPSQQDSDDNSRPSVDTVDSSHLVPAGNTHAQGAAPKPHHSALNSTSTLSQYVSDKPSYKVLSPKHLRRRHSDSSDNEELQQKMPQKRTEAPAASKSTTQPTEVPPEVSGSPSSSTSVESVHIPDRLLIDNLGNVLEVSDGTDLSVTSAQNEVFGQTSEEPVTPKAPIVIETNKVKRRLKTNLKSKTSSSKSFSRRVSFDPLALLLDASLEGELELVRKTAKEVPDVSASNDEGITALHNAICAGHYDIVKFLVEFGSDANAPDSDGWTPLHCAASCNNLPMVKLLVEHGACIFATTISDHETAAEKCEEDEDGYDGCSEYLYSIQEKLGIINNGVVFAVFDYKSQNADELSFRVNSQITVLRKGDDKEKEWWWSRIRDREGYVPRNLLGLSRRVIPDRGKP